MEDTVKFRIHQEAEQLPGVVTPFLAEIDEQQPGVASKMAAGLLEKSRIRLDLENYIRAGQLTELVVRFGYGLARYDATCGVTREIAFDRETGPAMSEECRFLLNILAAQVSGRVGFGPEMTLALNPLLTLAMVIGYAMGKQGR